MLLAQKAACVGLALLCRPAWALSAHVTAISIVAEAELSLTGLASLVGERDLPFLPGIASL